MITGTSQGGLVAAQRIKHGPPIDARQQAIQHHSHGPSPADLFEALESVTCSTTCTPVPTR